MPAWVRSSTASRSGSFRFSLWIGSTAPSTSAREPQRYGPTDFDVEPEWATEAATDPDRIVGPGGKRSIEVVGLSPSAPGRDGDSGRLLKVWLVPKTTAEAGDWWGASACEANERDRRDYDESKGG